MTPTAKPHLSPSALEMLARCGVQYERRYIDREIIPPRVAMLRGTGVHGGIEANMRQKIESHRDLPSRDIVDAAVSTFEQEAGRGYTLSAEESSRGKTVVLGEAKDAVASLAKLAAEETCPEYQPVLVEQGVRIELPDSPHDLFGVLDLADDRGRVIDVKTVSKSMPQSVADESLQLTAYAALHHAATGEPTTELRLDVLVSTKTPKRQVLATTRDAADLEALGKRISVASQVIQSGLFMPAPSGAWWCSSKWCGYHSTCPFVSSSRSAKED